MPVAAEKKTTQSRLVLKEIKIIKKMKRNEEDKGT